MKRLKKIFLIFSIINIHHINAQSTSENPDLYSPLYEYTFLNFDSIGRVYYTNNCLSVLDLRNNKCNPTIVRFYPTGEVSMLAKKCQTKIVQNDENFKYCFSAEVTTYYKNGNKRTEYTLDSIGNVNGELMFYNSNGELLSKTEYRNDIIYNGYFISVEEAKVVNIDYFENGELRRKYKYRNHILTLIQSNLKEKKINSIRGSLKDVLQFIDINLESFLLSVGAKPNE